MRIAICLFFAAMILAGCTTTEQPDGSTRVSVSLSDKLGLQPRNAARASASTPEAAPAADAARAPAPASGAGRQSDIPSSAPAAPRVSATKLAGVFAKHPYDGTSKTYFPRVAVTVTDWSRNDCWIGTATIWWSKTKSEAKRALGRWLWLVDKAGLEEFKNCRLTFSRWFEAITNIIKYQVTNGFTEGINNKIKVLKRVSYGIKTFKILRNRVLFSKA